MYATGGEMMVYSLVPLPVHPLLCDREQGLNTPAASYTFAAFWKEAKISLCFPELLLVTVIYHSNGGNTDILLLVPSYWASSALNGSEKSKFVFKGASKDYVHFWVNTPDVSHYRTDSFYCSFTLIRRKKLSCEKFAIKVLGNCQNL